MARTKASAGAKISSGKSSKARCSASPATPTASRSRSGGGEGYGVAGGGNRVKQRDTPPWQRPISSFFVSTPIPCSPCGAPPKAVVIPRKGSDDETLPSLAGERWSASDESMDVDMDIEADDAPQAAPLPRGKDKPSKGKGRGKKTRDKDDDESNVENSKRHRRDPQTPEEVQRPRAHEDIDDSLPLGG